MPGLTVSTDPRPWPKSRGAILISKRQENWQAFKTVSDRKVSILTISHSSLAVEFFLELLLRFGVADIVDVRSSSYLSNMPRYNREMSGRSCRRTT